MPDTLRIDNQMMGLAALSVRYDIIDNLLLIVIIFLRKQNILRTVGDAAPQSDIARISSHNLDDTAALMRGRSIPHLIDCLHGRVDCRIKSNGILCTGNIQINGSRQPNGINAMSGQGLRAAVRTVAADDHQTVYAMLMADIRSFLLAFLRAEFVTPGSS